MQNQLISNKKSPFPKGAWQIFTFYFHLYLLAQEAIKQASNEISPAVTHVQKSSQVQSTEC
ncbi:hypothetical protein CHI06_18035 [Bacillus sp. 7884-1]|nr:hypothetical protein CHI06_18035 [Bacillus sp. 7884-1]